MTSNIRLRIDANENKPHNILAFASSFGVRGLYPDAVAEPDGIAGTGSRATEPDTAGFAVEDPLETDVASPASWPGGDKSGVVGHRQSRLRGKRREILHAGV